MAVIVLTGYHQTFGSQKKVWLPKAIRALHDVFVWLPTGDRVTLSALAANTLPTDNQVQTFCDDYATLNGWTAD